MPFVSDQVLVAPDPRGHGQAGKAAPSYSLDDVVEDVIALLDALGIERTHFVGSSSEGCGAVICVHAPGVRGISHSSESSPSLHVRPALLAKWTC